nr:MAG TPA: hypothetical protein [Caudoviricetes sp.]
MKLLKIGLHKYRNLINLTHLISLISLNIIIDYLS